MGNEAKTKNLVREALRQKGYYGDKDIIVEDMIQSRTVVDRPFDLTSLRLK